MSLRPVIGAFGSIDGQLAVGGMPLDRLTGRVGSTPYFAYDRRLLTDRIRLLRATLPEQVTVRTGYRAAFRSSDMNVASSVMAWAMRRWSKGSR